MFSLSLSIYIYIENLHVVHTSCIPVTPGNLDSLHLLAKRKVMETGEASSSHPDCDREKQRWTACWTVVRAIVLCSALSCIRGTISIRC